MGGFNIGGVQQRAKEIATLKRNLLTAGHTAGERWVQGAFSIAAGVGGGMKQPGLYVPTLLAAILFAVRVYYNRKQILTFLNKLKSEFLALGDVCCVLLSHNREKAVKSRGCDRIVPSLVEERRSKPV